MDGELSLLWRVRKTVHAMLEARGYLLSQEDVRMELDDFRQRFGDPTVPGGAAHNAREALTILASSRDDPAQQIFVFWADEDKIGVKPIKKSALQRSTTQHSTAQHCSSLSAPPLSGRS